MAAPMVFESFCKLVILFKFMSDEEISNVRTTRITKIWTYFIKITSYHDTTVSITVVLAILTFKIVARNCQTLAHIRLVLSLIAFLSSNLYLIAFSISHIKFVFNKWQMSSWDGSILLKLFLRYDSCIRRPIQFTVNHVWKVNCENHHGWFISDFKVYT